jgi:hypothetical protein
MLGYPVAIFMSDMKFRCGLTAECRVGVGRLRVIGTESRFYVGHGATAARGRLTPNGI